MKNLNSIIPLYRWTVESLVTQGCGWTVVQHGAGTFKILDTILVDLNPWEEISVLTRLLRTVPLMYQPLRTVLTERLTRLTFSHCADRSIYQRALVSQRVR